MLSTDTMHLQFNRSVDSTCNPGSSVSGSAFGVEGAPAIQGSGFSGLGSGVEGVGFRIEGLGFAQNRHLAPAMGLRAWGLDFQHFGLRAWGLDFQHFGLRAWGLGFRLQR